jgi:predicted GTPase
MSEDWSAEKMEKLQKILKKMREDPLKYKRVHNAIIEAATMTPQEWNAAEEQAEREQQAKLEPRAEQEARMIKSKTEAILRGDDVQG